MSGFSEVQATWPSPGDIRQGLPLDVVDRALAKGDLSPAELDRLAFPRKTLAYRGCSARCRRSSPTAWPASCA